jgi:hypothetical protein
MPYTKLATIRDPDVPIGEPAPLHINCHCSQHLQVSSNRNVCQCGAIYDRRGYVVKASEASLTEVAQQYR